MSRLVLFAHPDNPALTWSGKGRCPKWVQAWLVNGGRMDALEAAAFRHGLRPAVPISAQYAVTGTENAPAPKADQAKPSYEEQSELPGLPPVPKKRGRPATGNAKSAAQRKRESRAKLRGVVLYGLIADFDAWLADATVAQLLEAYPLLLKNNQPLHALDVADRLRDIALSARDQ